MSTPITDANRLEIWADPYTECPDNDGKFVRFEIARRLETDRAALMSKLEASERHLAKLYAHTVADESSEIEEDGWILLCGVSSTLAAARANFPIP